MPSGLHFLMAAKSSEIADLTQLAQTCSLVSAVAQLVHALQLERGWSNLMLASSDSHWQAQRQAQIPRSTAAEHTLRQHLDDMVAADEPVLHRPRVLNRIAWALQGLDALPFLQQDVEQRLLGTAGATAAYSRLIEALLSMVFEAADTAADPRISQCLVAMFNVMQGKEYAGQERATGAAQFAAGQTHAEDQHRLARLIESQERCLGVFAELASPAALSVWQQAPSLEMIQQDMQRHRRMLMDSAPGGPLNPSFSQGWFDLCTARIDILKQVEDALAADLRLLCETRMAASQAQLEQYKPLQHAPMASNDALEQAARHFFRQSPWDERRPPHGSLLASDSRAGSPALERSILDMVQDQARQLQTMSDALDAARASLHERKVIERAKGLLMAHQRLSEEQAHKRMRQMAMNQNRRMVDVAQAILSMAEVLPSHPGA